MNVSKPYPRGPVESEQISRVPRMVKLTVYLVRGDTAPRLLLPIVRSVEVTESGAYRAYIRFGTCTARHAFVPLGCTLKDVARAALLMVEERANWGLELCEPVHQDDAIIIPYFAVRQLDWRRMRKHGSTCVSEPKDETISPVIVIVGEASAAGELAEKQSMFLALLVAAGVITLCGAHGRESNVAYCVGTPVL